MLALFLLLMLGMLVCGHFLLADRRLLSLLLLCKSSVHSAMSGVTGSVPESGVESRCLIRLINEFEVVIVLPCFNLLSSSINVVISPAL